MRKITLSFIMPIFLILQLNAAPLNDELIVLHHASTTEMNAIVSPLEGSLIFNTDDNEVYERNATAWNRISSDGSETKIIAGNCMEITGTGTSADPYVVRDKNLGETQVTAGTTCKQILDNGCEVRDGVYWINPNGGSTADAFEVYCDMITNGGGWTRLDYASDLAHLNRWTDGDQRRWLPSNFNLTLTDTQINDIRATSTEGKQIYKGTCDGVIHYKNGSSNYGYAFGFRFHDNSETAFGQETYPNTNIVVTEDGCSDNGNLSIGTLFEINDIRVPVINVYSRDNGNGNEKFGSPLTKYPAWLR